MSIEDLRNMSIEELKSNEKFMSEVAKEYESTLEEFLSSPPKMIEMAINEYLQKYSEINLDIQKKPQNIQDTMEAILQATEKNTVTAEETTKRIQTLQEQVGELQDTVTTLQDTVKKQDAKIDMLQRENNSQSEQIREQGEAFSAMLETKRDDIEYMTKKKTGAKKATIYILTDDKIFDYNKDENGKVGFQQVPIEDKEILETLKRGEVCQKDNKVYVPVIDTDKKVIGVVVGEDVPSIDNFVDVVQNQDNVRGKAILGNVQVKYSEVKAMIAEEQAKIAEEKAKTDEMTGLLNKAGKEEYIKKELIESAKKGESIATIMIDGDNFKSINDTYGHVAGDTVLKKWAEIMMECASEIMKKYSSDKVEVDVKVFRVGGDEAQAFVKINDQQENGENKVYIGAITYELAEMIRRKVAETKIEVINSESRKYEQVNTTISVGVAKVDTQNLTEDNVMEKMESVQLDVEERLKDAKSGTGKKIVGRPELKKNVTSTTPEVDQDVVDALMQESPDKILAIIQAEKKVFDKVKENVDRIPSDKFSYLIENCEPFREAMIIKFTELMKLSPEQIHKLMEESRNYLSLAEKYAGNIPRETFDYLIENCKPFHDWIERPSENLNNGTNDKETEQEQTGATVADPGYVPEASAEKIMTEMVEDELDVPAQEPGHSIAEASKQNEKYIPNKKSVDAKRGNKPHGKDDQSRGL